MNKKNKIFLIIALISFFANTKLIQAANIVVPDSALKQAILQELGLPNEHTLTDSDMESLTTITANNAGITSLEGLQHAKNLGSVSFSDNKISDVSYVPTEKLTQFDFNNNNISDVTPLIDSYAFQYSYQNLEGNHINDLYNILKKSYNDSPFIPSPEHMATIYMRNQTVKLPAVNVVDNKITLSEAKLFNFNLSETEQKTFNYLGEYRSYWLGKSEVCSNYVDPDKCPLINVTSQGIGEVVVDNIENNHSKVFLTMESDIRNVYGGPAYYSITFEIPIIHVSKHTVTYDSKGGSEVAPINDVVTNSLITKPTKPTKKGYIFEGWYLDLDSNKPWNFNSDKITKDTTLYAKWSFENQSNNNEKQKLKVIFDSNGGSKVAPIVDVPYNLLIDKPTNPTRKGYTFTGWYLNLNSDKKWDFNKSKVIENTTLYAKWEKKDLTLPKTGLSIQIPALVFLVLATLGLSGYLKLNKHN